MEKRANMDKINQVFFLLIARDRIATPDGIYLELNKLITNDLFSLMGDDWDIAKVNSEKPHIQEALSDTAYLLAAKAIEHRHAKTILSKEYYTSQKIQSALNYEFEIIDKTIKSTCSDFLK